MTALAERQEWLVSAHKPGGGFWTRKKNLDAAELFLGSRAIAEYLPKNVARAQPSKTVVPRVDEHVRQLFHGLSKEWQADTMFLSSVHQRVLHPSYQRIIGLGPQVLPLLIADLYESKNDWFWALRSISGEDPVPEAFRGNRGAMIDCWLKWAKSKELF